MTKPELREGEQNARAAKGADLCGGSRSGVGIMDLRGRSVFPRIKRFLITAGCVWLLGTPPVLAQLADGVWTVQGERIPGSLRCGEWRVRITNARGQLSGTVSHARAIVAIQNLVLMPDGSLSGTAPADFRHARHAHPSKITGRFSGDALSLTFETDVCSPRQGTATRRPASG